MKQLFEDKLSLLAEDTPMLEAIRFLFDKRINEEKPTIDKGDNNTRIGEKYRAYDQCKKILNQVFLDIDSYKSEKVDLKEINKGQ